MISLSRKKVLLVVLFGLAMNILTGCELSPIDKAKLAELAKVKKIALVTFVGRSKTSPSDTVHHALTQSIWDAFKAKAAADTNVIKFISNEYVINNEAYKQVAPLRLPKGAFSPIDGLTYVKYGVEGGFDCEPLVSSLNVDALLMIFAEFGVAVRQNGTQPYLTADVRSGLIIPPEDLIWDTWKRPEHFEEPIMVTMLDHPKLMASIGAKWVILQRPSESEYAELTQIALEKNPKMPTEAGEAIFDEIVASIKKAQESSVKQSSLR